MWTLPCTCASSFFRQNRDAVSSLASRLSWRWQRLRISDIKHPGPFIQNDELSTPRCRVDVWVNSRVGITLDLYSHVLPGMQEDAAARIDELFQIAEKKLAGKIG